MADIQYSNKRAGIIYFWLDNSFPRINLCTNKKENTYLVIKIKAKNQADKFSNSLLIEIYICYAQ